MPNECHNGTLSKSQGALCNTEIVRDVSFEIFFPAAGL